MTNQKDFWESIVLLLSVEVKRSDKDFKDKVHDWVEKVVTPKPTKVQEELGRDDAAAVNAVAPKSKSKRSPLRFRSRFDQEVADFVAKLDLPKIECKFSHPQVRSRMEKLMGSDLVSLTDRNYMIFLQERILLDYTNSMTKRISTRQAEEMERVKLLVLTGKIPLDQAPSEMANHPVMMIDQYCRKVLAEKRAKLKLLKTFIPKYLYWDDTPDPPSGLSIESGHVFRPNNDRLCIPPDIFLATEESENIADGYMFSDEEFELLKYENPMVKQLKDCETVEEMYRLADEIIGILESMDDEEEAEEEEIRE